MNVLGIIAEYNPFHNGHLYHLEQSRKLCSTDYTVCVMSGSFIQRGEPALVNKWARAEMALLSGIDLVLELPVVYAMSSAEYFAYGGVKILDSLGIVDHLCFGSESGSLEGLKAVAEVLHNEPQPYKELLKKYLNGGISYPAARESALKEYFERTDGFSEDIGSTMGQSNNILGVEYLKALKRLGSRIKPFTISRIHNSYNTEDITGSISSATSIRKYIFDRPSVSPDSIPVRALPEPTIQVLEREFGSGRGPVFSHSFASIILASIRKMSSRQLKLLPYVSEGLENRIKDSADNSGTLYELIDKVCTKRYTRTRIQRALFHLLTGLTSNEFDNFNQNGGPQYIRVLGFNSKGRQLLSALKDTASLPVIVKAANFKNTSNPLVNRMLEIESHSTDMYVLGYQNPEFRYAGQEFTQNVVMYEIDRKAKS